MPPLVDGVSSCDPQAIERYHAWVNPEWIETLDALGILREFVWAGGSRLRDSDGNEFLDMVAGFGSAVLGHNNPDLLERLYRALERQAPGIVPWGFAPETGMLAERLCRLAERDLTKVHFATSGAEAVDSALKFAAAATGRREFLSSRGGFHGTTVGATGLAGGGPWKDPFPHIWPSTRQIAPNDLAELERALRDSAVAALIIEVIQATGGGATWSGDSLTAAGEICRRHGTLVVVDEVLTGLGRTGAWFAFHDAGAAFCPDMVLTAKALSGGILPISAVLMTDSVYSATFAGGRAKIHGSTFSGSRLGVTCGLAVLELLERDRILERVKTSSAALIGGLKGLAAEGLVGEIRGRGLAVGVEICGDDGRVAAAECLLSLMERGILTNVAAHAPSYLKLTPPLTFSEQDCEMFVDTLRDVLLNS